MFSFLTLGWKFGEENFSKVNKRKSFPHARNVLGWKVRKYKREISWYTFNEYGKMFPREPKKKWNKCMHDLWTSGGNCFESFLRHRQKYKVKWQIIILAEISRFAGDFYVLLHHHTPFTGIVFHELVKAILARISIRGFTSSRNDRKACAWTQQQLRWSRIFMELACAIEKNVNNSAALETCSVYTRMFSQELISNRTNNRSEKARWAS